MAVYTAVAQYRLCCKVLCTAQYINTLYLYTPSYNISNCTVIAGYCTDTVGRHSQSWGNCLWVWCPVGRNSSVSACFGVQCPAAPARGEKFTYVLAGVWSVCDEQWTSTNGVFLSWHTCSLLSRLWGFHSNITFLGYMLYLHHIGTGF